MKPKFKPFQINNRFYIGIFLGDEKEPRRFVHWIERPGESVVTSGWILSINEETGERSKTPCGWSGLEEDAIAGADYLNEKQNPGLN